MNILSLEVRKRIIAENLSQENDLSAIEEIEEILRGTVSPVRRFTVKELEKRAMKAEDAIEAGRVYSIAEVRNKLGL